MPLSVNVRGPGIVGISLRPPLEFIEDQLDVFKDRLLDLSGLWSKFANVMGEIERERFRTEGFGEWPALAASTVEQKSQLGFPPFPLIRTGDLYESLTDVQRAARMDPQRMTWGTDVDYAIYHQGVSEAGEPTNYGGRPPERKVLDLRVQDRRRLEQQMVVWINEVAAETFRGRAVA